MKMLLVCLPVILLVACPAPEPPPVAKKAPTPPVAAKAEQPQTTGHCAAGEQALFSCVVQDGKTLSLCGSAPGPDGWLQYRFGQLGEVELAWPEDRAYGRFVYTHEVHSRSMSDNVAFTTGPYTFTVSFQEGGGDQSFAGVVVDKDGAQVSLKRCTTDPGSRLDELAAVLPGPPVDRSGTYRNDRGTVEVKEVTGDQLTFSLDVSRGPPSYNMGSLDDVQATLKGSTATYRSTEWGVCEITMVFGEDQVTLETTEGGPGPCGFGAGVMADGVYSK